MARRLVDSGCSVVVHDPNEAAVTPLTARGAISAASPADVADQAGLVLCSLPTPAVVEQVMLGSEGLVHGKAARTIVDLSTTGRMMARKVASGLAKVGIELLDGPVSGGAPGAEAGTLTLMISGNQQAYDQARPFLEKIGRNIFYVGVEPGLGQSMKVVNNLLFAANLVSAMEVLVMGAKAGLDPQTILDVVNVSSGRSFVTTDRIPQTVLPRTFPERFATELLFKDVKLGIDEAERLGSPLYVTQTVRALLAFAVSQGDGGVDCANLIKHFEGWAGVKFGEQQLG
jgi:3-hydroxyisobutyrate dehydrogenase